MRSTVGTSNVVCFVFGTPDFGVHMPLEQTINSLLQSSDVIHSQFAKDFGQQDRGSLTDLLSLL